MNEKRQHYVSHKNNDCYEWYTHKTQIQALEAELGVWVYNNKEMDISESFTTTPMVRSSVTPRDAAVEDIGAAAL